MTALPDATSQGSNGAGGGAFKAFIGMSAANAEPATIASAVANKVSFLMTIPHHPRFMHRPGFDVPRTPAKAECVIAAAMCDSGHLPGSKKAEHMPTFWAIGPFYGRLSDSCCISTTKRSCLCPARYGLIGAGDCLNARRTARRIS